MLLGDERKMQLFHHVCCLLPEERQTEFDQLAAASLSAGGPKEQGGEWLHEGVCLDKVIYCFKSSQKIESAL